MLRRALLLIATLGLLAGLLPGAGATATAETSADGERPLDLDGRQVVELAAPTPDWYTDELHARVVAAGAEGVPIPEDVELPTSALLFQGIRPGSWMISPAWCTMNFVFNGGSGGSGKGNGQANGNGHGLSNGGGGSGLAIGTAGHCAEVDDEVVLIMAPGVLVYIGDTTRSVDRGVGNDFALVDIRPDVAELVNPSMAIVAGPTGTGDPAFGDAVLHVGHGVVVGTGGTARAGVASYRDGDAYGWTGVASPGDSGSAVREATGDAVGNLTHLVVGTRYLPAVVAGTSAERMEQIAGMSIATASLVPDPLP